MTRPAVRLPTHSQSDRRRPGIFPRRRFALAAVVACAAAAGGATLPASAAADQPVVSATIFPGAEGSASTAQVMLSTLNTCASYAGPSSITMQSASQTLPAQPVSEPAWTLGTVLTCGLQIPTNDVTAVQVVSFSGAYETPLSNAQIFDTDQYPGSDGALPTIYMDGGESQTTYVRPPLNASDANAADNVIQQGDPVSLIVYENQPPLVVAPTQSPVAGSQSTTEQVTLGATVTTADGTTVPSSALTFSWTANGQPLTGPAPVVTVDAGVTPVTVQAYDPATGTGGTDTFDITYNPPASPSSPTPGSGAGNDKNGNPTGSTHGKQNSHGQRKLKSGGGLDHAGTNPGAGKTSARRHSTTSPSKTPATKPATKPATASATTPATGPTVPSAPPPTQTTTVTTTATTPAPGLTVDSSPTKAPPHPRSHAPKRRSVARPGASERVVTGRLVADLQAVPAGASPLVHPIAAQAAAPSLVHGASDATSAPTWAYAALAVLALLGGGALYERRGRRGRTLHR